MRLLFRLALMSLSAVLAATLAVVNAPPAHAAGETFKVLSRNATGCSHGQFTLNVEKAGFDANAYFIHTVVTAGGLIYTNELASQASSGSTIWGLYDNFSYGPVPNPGTWPIPAGVQMQIDFTLERPQGGAVLHQWRTVVDGCTTGNILYNNEPSLDTDNDLVAVPADQCPGAAAATPNGCPQIARRLTLKYKANAEQFRGRIRGAAPALGNTKQVTIYRKRPGADKKIGRTRTDSNGRFRLYLDASSGGKYYAITLAVLDPNVGQAGDAKSRTVRVR